MEFDCLLWRCILRISDLLLCRESYESWLDFQSKILNYLCDDCLVFGKVHIDPLPYFRRNILILDLSVSSTYYQSTSILSDNAADSFFSSGTQSLAGNQFCWKNLENCLVHVSRTWLTRNCVSSETQRCHLRPNFEMKSGGHAHD